MTLGSPMVALIGLIAALAPILIHLFWRRRRTPTPWAAIQFVIEAVTRTRRRRRIEHILIIAVRTLVLVLAAIALARPFASTDTPDSDASRARHIYIIIDDSLASAVSTDGFTALHQHGATATELIEHLHPVDRVAIILASAPEPDAPYALSLDHAALTQRLASLKPSNRPANINTALRAAHTAMNAADPPPGGAHIFLFSEFRAGSTISPLDIEPFATLNSVPMTLHAAPPADHAVKNVTIEAVEPIRRIRVLDDPMAPDQATVRLTRSGDVLPAAAAILNINFAGQTRVSQVPITWREGQTELAIPVRLPAPAAATGLAAYSITISGDALALDNQYFGVLDMRETLRVLIVDRRPIASLDAGAPVLTTRAWIASALRPTDDSPLELTERDPTALTTEALDDVDVMFMLRPDLLDPRAWITLRAFVDRGGLLILMPPANIDDHPWTAIAVESLGLDFVLRASTVDHDPPLTINNNPPPSPMFALIAGELSELTRAVSVTRSLKIDQLGEQTQIALRLSDDAPLIIAAAPSSPAPSSSGRVLLFASPMNPTWTNLPTKPLMVPLLHELIRKGLDQIHASHRRIIGPNAPPMLEQNTRPILLADTDAAFLPGAPRRLTPGVHQVLNAAPPAPRAFSVNIDPRAARTEIQSPDVVYSWLAPAGRWSTIDLEAPADALRAEEDLGRWSLPLLACALILLLIETVLARRFSRAERADHPGADDGLASTVLDRSRTAAAGGGA